MNSGSELDLTKIEGEFLRGILQEQVELNWSDERAEESEWYLFLENLSPVIPQDGDKVEGCEFYKEQNPTSANSSLREWDVLLNRLSQMETDVVQQILRRVDSDVLQGMLKYLHMRMMRGNPQETERDKSIALTNKEVPSNCPSNVPPPDQTEEAPTHSFQVLGQNKHMESNERSMPKQLSIFGKCPGTIDWLRWRQERIPRHPQSRCYFLKDIGEQVTSDQLGNSSQQGQSKLEGTLRRFKQQQVPQIDLPKSSEHHEPDQKDIFEQPPQNRESKSEPALPGLKQQLPQNFLSKSLSQGELDQEVYEEPLQHRESEPLSKPASSSDSNTRQTLNLNFRQRCSQQIESKLAEIPCQIASTLFMRTPQYIDAKVLHQLFRQIDNILFQVMPQQILFDSIQPKQVEPYLFDYVHWHAPREHSLPRQLDDGLEYGQLNQLELLNPHHWHPLQSTEILQNVQQIPHQNDCTNSSKNRELEQMPYEGNQSLDYQVDRCIHSCQNVPCVWSAMFQYPAEVPNYLQLLPKFVLSTGITHSPRYPKQDTMPFICSTVSRTWNPPTTKTEPRSSPHPLLLDMLPQPDTINNISLPTLDSDHSILDSLPSIEVLLPDISLRRDSSPQGCTELPQEQQQKEVQKYMLPLAGQNLVHLLPQSFMEFPFPQMDPIEVHALRQKMCLSVLQEIAKQVEYSISRGLPVEINDDLLQALDLYPRDFWLQPPGGEREANNDYFYHHPKESWEVQHTDVDWDAYPRTSPPTENSKDFGELHEDMNSTSGWTTEPSDAESPRYYPSDPILKLYRRHSSYKDVDVNRVRQHISYENVHYESEENPNESAPVDMMPLYTSPLNILEDVRQYIEMVTGGDELQDRSEEMEFDPLEPSPDYVSSMNLLWAHEDEPRQSRATEQPVGGRIGHSLDFYVDGLAGTTSDLLWVLNPSESLNLAEAPQDQFDDTTNDSGNDFFVSGDLQVDILSESSTKHMQDSHDTEGSSLEGTDSSSQSSRFHGSGSSSIEAQQLQANPQLDELCCDCCQSQLPESTRLQDSYAVDQVRQGKQRKSVELNPQIASVSSLDGLGGTDSSSSSNSNQHADANAISNQTHRFPGVQYKQRSETSEEPQVDTRGSSRLESPGNGCGKPRQSHTSSSNELGNEESRGQGASTSESPKGYSSMVKLTKKRTSRKSPTVSQFHDPSTPVRHTIFGLVALAGGLYLVDNRDAIEQQSVSAAEAATEAWRWLGSFLIRMARGEFDN